MQKAPVVTIQCELEVKKVLESLVCGFRDTQVFFLRPCCHANSLSRPRPKLHAGTSTSPALPAHKQNNVDCTQNELCVGMTWLYANSTCACFFSSVKEDTNT